MEYPTLEQVETADAEQLADWFRFLPTPGVNAVNTTQPIDKVNAAIAHEGEIMDRIVRRLNDEGLLSAINYGGQRHARPNS